MSTHEAILLQGDGFCALDTDAQKALLRHTTFKHFETDNIVFYKGDMPKCFHVFLHGELKSYRHDKKYNEITVHHITARGLFGEIASLENIPFPSNCKALCASVVACIDRDFFMSFLLEHKSLTHLLLRSLSQKIRILQRVIDHNLVFDALTKVAYCFQEAPNYFALQSKKDIAQKLNMAPETLSRTLNKLKNLDILDVDLSLKNPHKLQILLDQA